MHAGKERAAREEVLECARPFHVLLGGLPGHQAAEQPAGHGQKADIPYGRACLRRALFGIRRGEASRSEAADVSVHGIGCFRDAREDELHVIIS